METFRRVAFVCSRMTNSFARIVWYSLQDSARQLGVRLTVVMGGPVDHPQHSVEPSRVYGVLDARNFDGVILYTASLSYFNNPEALDRLVKAMGSLPVVSFGWPLPGIPSVVVDQAAAVKQMVRHLRWTHGFKAFALVTGPLSQVEARIRRTAFYEVMDELAVPRESLREFQGNYSRDSGAEAVRSLAEAGVFPTALVCANDDEALGAREEARVLGIRVPADLGIIGFDDTDLAVNQEPGITSAGLPLLVQARRSLELLVRLMDHKNGVPLEEHLEALVWYRESCGCLRSSVQTHRTRPGIIAGLLATQVNVTTGFRDFLGDWIPSYFSAFESLLESGGPTAPIQTLWNEYLSRTGPEQDRGLPMRQLFAGLEILYSSHPSFPRAYRENLLMARSSESYKGALNDQKSRDFNLQLHGVELEILQVNNREALANLSFQALVQVGVAGVALVRFGVPPALVYSRTLWTEPVDPAALGAIEYPALLPGPLADLDQPSDRVVAALTVENHYLGYAVFWVRTKNIFVCDFLANQFAGVLQRLSLLEKIEAQRESLQASLDESTRMRQQLVETEKVASLGRLVAGVAHEVNTPLGTGITGTSFLLDRLGEIRGQLEDGTLGKAALDQFLSVGEEALSGVLRNLMKAGELIQAFKGLGLDHGQGEWRPVEIRALFRDLEVLYTGELAQRGVTLRCELPDSNVLIYSQPSALVQVAGELLENAMIHAFPPDFGGDPQVLLQIAVADGNLRMAVTDNGRGLEPEERRLLFDPLYTTKRTEGHAGLGLHLAFQLVSRTLGGRMTVASEPGAGSCFLCEFPLNMG